MNQTGPNPQRANDAIPVTPASACQQAADLSCRIPLTLMFLGATLWLLLSSLLALLASIHLHSPGFMADSAWLGYGRLQPAAYEALLYGFCLPAGTGIGLWLFARLGRTALAVPVLTVVGTLFWNAGVALGIGGILVGDRTGFPGLDMPGYAAPVLLAGYVLTGLSAALTFHARTEKPLFVSQWFLLAALFWFPWIFSTAQIFLVIAPVRGVAQATIAWWFANNLQNVYLWLTGLAAVFYFLPKITGNDLHSRYLALLTFWMVILFSSWGGISASAPVPAWMPALSLPAAALALVTAAAVGISAWRTTRGASAPGAQDPTLRFIRFGVVSFVLAGVMQSLSAMPRLSEITDLTWFGAARAQLNLLGFFAMTAFGSIYYIVPRLAGADCLCPKGRRVHFWLTASGIMLTVAPQAAAGLLEGIKMQNPNLAFADIAAGSLHFLRVSTLGLCLVALGQFFLLINLSLFAVRGWRQCTRTTYAALTADRFKPAGVKS